MVRIGVLGPLEIDERTARLGTRDRIVLAALAMNPGDLLTQEQIADAVWGDQPPASWSKNLQGCISRLRKLLGADAIETSPLGYRLRVPPDDVDATAFTRRAHRARELLTLRECEHARYAATQALDLWRGRPLGELDQWDAGCVEAGRLSELRAELEEIVIEASLAAGHHREVLGDAAAMVETAPLRERRWALLARAQYQAGRQAEALRTLRRIRVVLQQELGLDPSPELVELEQAILRQDPSLLVDAAPELGRNGSPYPGLKAYSENETESFFGREDEIRTCLARLEAVPLVAVIGASGTGKSSLLRAGISPALRRQGADVVVLTPGVHPVESLAAAAPGAHSVLLVDQLEEAFTLCRDDAEREQFFAAIVDRTERGRVVLALRADHTGDLAAQQGLATLVELGLVLLAAMTADGLRAAIDGPALRHGLVLEPGLADLLVREVEGEAGALPLLSHALRETWLRHEGRALTVAGYQESGGIRGAVAQSAERLYAQLEDAERTQLRDLVLRLVFPGPEGEPVRGRVPRDQAVVAPTHERLIDLMVAARLVTSDDGSIELAHEAVVRAWPRLRGWLEEDLDGQRMRHHLTQATEDWTVSGRLASELYRGPRLAAALEWVRSAGPQLTDHEQRFLNASERLAAEEERSAVELAQTRGRMVRRLRYALVGAALLLVIAMAAGFVAVGQTGRARDEANAAQARQLSAQALGDADISLSALLAVAAVKLDDTPETRATLSRVLAQHPALVATSAHIGSAVDRLLRSPDGTRLAVFDADNVVSLVDARTGAVTARYDADGPGTDNRQFFQVSPMAFSPDGRILAIGAPSYGAPPLTLLDGRTLEPLPNQPSHLPALRVKAPDVAFSANGRFLAASFMILPAHDRVWRLDAPDHTRTLVWNLGHLNRPPLAIGLPFTGFAERMALSPDGRRVYLSSPVAAYSTHGARLWRLPGEGTWLPLDLSADGTRLAVISGAAQDEITVVGTEHGNMQRTLTGGPNLDDIALSDDGRQVAAVGRSQLLTWDISSPRPTRTMRIEDAWGVQLDPSASVAYVTDNTEGTVVTWDLHGSGPYLRLISSHPALASVAPGFLLPGADGVHVADFSNDLNLVNMVTGTVSPVPAAASSGWFTPGSWRPDGRRFAMGTEGGHVQVFDAAGHERNQAKVAQNGVSGVDFTSDGRSLAVSDLTGRVSLLDAVTLQARATPVRVPGSAALVTVAPNGHTAFVVTTSAPLTPGVPPPLTGWALVDLRDGRVLRSGHLPESDATFDDFSPDGAHVAVSFASGRMLIIDTRNGQPVDAQLPTHRSNILWLTYSPDGTRVLTGDESGTQELWDARSGEVLDSVTVPGGDLAAGQFRPGTTDVTILARDGRVLLWDTRPQRAIDFACRTAGRDLTTQEWNTYLGSRPRFPVCPA